jgi:hypothetical protein
MRKIYLLFLCLNFFNAHGQSWQWMNSIRNGGASLYDVTAIDNDIYSVCFARDTIYFPQFHTTILPDYSFLVKTGEHGDLIWVRKLGHTWASNISDNSADIFVAERELPVDYPAYLSCYDTSGNLKWINTIPDPANCYSFVYDLETDNNGNSFMLTYLPSYCTSYSQGKGDWILSKYDLVSQLMWNDTLDSTIRYPYVHTDRSGNIYISGVFNDSIKFIDQFNTFFYNNSSGAFLVKMDSVRNINWMKIIPTSFSFPCFPGRVVTDNNNNIYLPVGTQTNFICDNILFNGSAVIKFTPAGLMSSSLYTGTGTPQIKYMADNTIGINAQTFGIGSHKFIKADTALNIIYSANILFQYNWGPHEAYFDSDMNGNFLIGGYSDDSLSFSNSSIILPMLNFFDDQVYYTTYGTSATVNVTSQNNPFHIQIFPNPTHSTFTLQYPQSMVNSQLNIYNSMGELVFSKRLAAGKNEIDLREKPGIYFVQAEEFRQKLVIY